MASVWVPFTSESKEAIADYDEIRKEITLGLREAGRRLGVFIKRRERAHDESKRRDIFELYIEEVVGACRRLKGGKLAEGKLREQLVAMAKKLTGGQKTDELLDKHAGPHGLPDSIIVTAEGIEGEVPVDAPPAAEAAPVEAPAPAAAPAAKAKAKPKSKPKAAPKAKPAKKRSKK
jgi:DNA topoisomerase-6 subunit B